MQKNFSSIPLKNTYRDTNEIPPPSQDFVLPSEEIPEPMDVHSESYRSIIQPVETDSSLLPRINSPNRIHITSRPLVKSIVRSTESDDEQSSQEQPELLHNRTLINNNNNNNNNNSILEASGYDASRSADVDADAAYALKLQEEEYSRGSIMPVQHPFFPFQVDQDDEVVDLNPPIVLEPNVPQFENDEEYAAYLQQQENLNRQRYHRPHVPYAPRRQRSNPTSTQNSETNNSENEMNPGIRFAQRPPFFVEDDDDDDDDEGNRNIHARAFFQFLANHNSHGRGDIPPVFFPRFRRGHRHTGNLQDTEEDFGPEDYERLLQLDDTIHKKKLTKEQINSIPIERFQHRLNNSDEENKCGVCLEFFEEHQSLRRFPCRHVYHKECGDRWLQENNVCPICREPPVKVQSTSNSRHQRHIPPFRRSSNNHRNPPSRPNNNNNTTTTHHHHHHNNNNNNNNNNNHYNNRKGPTSNRQS